MNNILKKVFLFAYFLCLLQINLLATQNDSTAYQNEANPEATEEADTEIILDTLSFKYKFIPGDSLYYSVYSRDSISINYDDPLLRLREEKILITCDSINSAGNFCLTQTLINFTAIESYQEQQNVKRETTNWLNVPIYIELDSLGRRIKLSNPDTNLAAATPGGAFQPILLLPLIQKGVNLKAKNESWLNSSMDTLAENAMPVPIFKSMTLMRLMGHVDTLGYNTIKFSFSRSGQASHELVTKEYSMKTSAIINSGGDFFLDTNLWVPIHLVHSMEQKLKFYYPDNRDQPGKHFIYSTFVLDKIIRSDEKNTGKNINKQ